MNTKAFTLIELLVVVLIIGILAAVALPQYNKAVFKSRASEALANLKNLKNALEVCELENGRITDTGENPCRESENLAIFTGKSIGNTFETDNFNYRIDRGTVSDKQDIAFSAWMKKQYDICLCIHDDGHFSTPSVSAGCDTDNYPNFNVAQTLGISEDDNCTCC